jgi:hypothetical protein
VGWPLTIGQRTQAKKNCPNSAYIRWVVWVVGMVLRGMLFALIQRVDRLEMLMSKETIPEQGGEAEQSDIRFNEWYKKIMVMDGLSRIAWSHGLPWKYDNEQFTIAIKFPAIEREAPIEYDHFKYMDVVAQIPSYVQTSIPTGWAVSRPTRRQ